MIIRRTKKNYTKFLSDLLGSNDNIHKVKILRTTYWFLFIPIYSTEKIITSNL